MKPFTFCIFLLFLFDCSGTKVSMSEHQDLMDKYELLENEKSRILLRNRELEKRYQYLKSTSSSYTTVDNFGSISLVCDATFMAKNFPEECLLQIMSLSNSSNVVNLENVRDCIVFILSERGKMTYFLYSPKGKPILDKYKVKYNNSFYKCSFKTNKITNSKPSIRQKVTPPKIFKGIDLSTLSIGSVNYCGGDKLQYRLYNEIPTGKYIQLAIVKYFRCERFLKCPRIGAIMIEKNPGEDTYRVFVNGTDYLNEIRKCRDFKDAFIVKK